MRQSDFPILQHTGVHWLDNAATTHKPEVVLQAMDKFARQEYANVHRGIYRLAEVATARYEGVRDQMQQWLHASSREEIIFTSGTTAGLNLVAAQLSTLLLKPGDVILTTPFEHHSNLVPWQMAAKRHAATLEFFDVTADDSIDRTTIAQKLHSRVKIVTLAHISNAIGTVHPIAEIIHQAHQRNIPVVIDAAQSAAHFDLDVQTLDCDFLALSAHKLCGPTGVGVLYGKRRWLEQLEPQFGGGDMIRSVTLSEATWNDLPYKFEAGTPNIMGVIGLGAALEYLTTHTAVDRAAAVTPLYNQLLDELAARDYITVYGPTDRNLRHSIVSFTVQGAHPHDVAQMLDVMNVAVRAGHHCAQPVMERWQVPATVRASIYFYNTAEDVQALVQGLDMTYKKFSV